MDELGPVDRNNTQGRGTVATGVAAGTVAITVAYQGKSNSATLTVTALAALVQITITPESPPSLPHN